MKTIFVPWGNMPAIMVEYVENNVKCLDCQQDSQKSKSRNITPDELFDIILQIPPPIRLPMLVANLADFIICFVPQENRKNFFDDFISRIEAIIKEFPKD